MTTIAGRIARTGVVLLAGYLLLALLAVYWQVVRADELVADPTANAGRLYQEELRVARGRILDRNGVVLAETVTAPDGTRQRRYPHPGTVHVVGYHSARFGESGMEAVAGGILSGRTGVSALLGIFWDLLHQPRRGGEVRLTLDSRIQQAAEAAMGGQPGAVVALNPRTGEVLALVSTPGFDPNRLEQQWETLRTSPARPLLNRATQGRYSPGSTFKTVTLATALEAGLVDALTPIRCPEQLNVAGFPVRSRNEPSGKTTRTVRDAYAYSCNTAFAELGLQVGQERLTALAGALGLGERIPFELETAAGQVSSTPEYVDSPQGLAVTAFGQGEVLVTPLHLALIAAAVANDGLVPVPRLTAGKLPATWQRAMSPPAARALAEIMEYSVEEGWAAAGAVPGVRVAGKTGTAEVGERRQPHAVFIAFAPVEAPRIAVAVLKEQGGAGSTAAGPVVRAVLQAALK
ncbi:MAG: penicillin-binding protein 2 [Chloroflexi bacterium]|nr:penicillin-binding protein 2 [Chloroflexota bacterium]